MSSSSGTKVTNDPSADTTTESSGFVASDSLAAESMDTNRSAGFAANDSNAAASGQGSHGATASNSDTSGASTLDSARDREERGGGFESKSYDEVNDETRGAGKSEGRGPTWNTDGNEAPKSGFGGASGGPGGDSGSGSYGSGDSGSGSGRGYSESGRGGERGNEGPRSGFGGASGGDSSGSGDRDTSYGSSGGAKYGDQSSDNAGTAPSYVSSNELGREQTDKPKGKNIQEGGFDDSAPNASFESDIGGKDDPGLAAESKFQRENAQSGSDAAGGPRQGGVSGDGQYDNLGDTEA